MKDASAIRRIDLLPSSASKSSKVALLENALDDREANDLLEELSKTLPFHVETDDFGPQSRPTCYYGDSPECIFAYVGLRLTPKPWTPTLRRLREKVSHACQLEEEAALTACLINCYPPGEGYIPWHYDEIRAHGATKTVASLSLGGPRRFQLRERDGNKSMVADLLLPSGSILLMQGTTQEEYEHCLPVQAQSSPLRISLTFRSIVPGWETDQNTATDVCCSQPPDYAE